MTLETAILGGGCFWCLEAVYQRLAGVKRVVSGYMGGHLANPDYESVCGAKTGHAEVVSIEFDASVIRYQDLLDVFFAIHDPTTLNRQGNDVGPQYRSVIVALSPEQFSSAQAAIAAVNASGVYRSPVVTELVDASGADYRSTTEGTFWPAESMHHDYFNRHPGAGYCVFVVAPKVIKAQEKFKALIAR